ncbi:MAG: hypothetical protein KDA31_14290 [Phycisphaerales bacterium]|nr:hypothetical protein [Phycisphaerales bacterium]MCB9835527.1 hypothetical protein [Phycisphaera sp.]
MKRWPALLLTIPASLALADENDRQGLLSSPVSSASATLTELLAAGPLDSPNAGDDTFVKIRAGGMYVFANGEITSGDEVNGSTNVLDLEDTLGQDTDDFSPIGSVAVAIPVIDLLIEAGYVGSYTFDGSTTESVSFDDDEFTGTVSSSEDLDIYEVNLLYELAEVKFVTVYIGGGVRLIDAHAEITGDVMGTTETHSEDLFLPIPVAAVGANLDLGYNIAIRGQVAGLYLGDYGTIIDAKAELGYDFNRFFGIFVGYRLMSVESREFDLEVDAALQGIYAGAEVRF